MKRLLMFCVMMIFLIPITAQATSWAYESVTYKDTTYRMTKEMVDEVGDKIGEVTSYSDMEQLEGNFSNRYKVGTGYYKIVGVDASEAIAVEVYENTYKKAIAQPKAEVEPIIKMKTTTDKNIENTPSDENESNIYMWVVITAAILVLALIFIILQRDRNRKR